MNCENSDDVQFEDDGLDEVHDYSIPLSPRCIQELEPSANWSGGGTCGVYLLCDKSGAGIAVFKPQDEETIPEHAIGMIEGENLYRERAAYLVSRKLGDLGVPATVIETLSHPRLGDGQKIGSLQRFVPLSTDMSDLGPSGIPADQVHKMGCLDILLFNVDRHEGNILLRRTFSNSNELVPIDHGLCLPKIVSRETGANKELLQGIFFAWQTWPQARTPFSAKLQRLLSKLTRENVELLVRALCKDRDIALHLEQSTWTTLKIGAALLRTLARHTLADIAALVRTKLPDLISRSWILSQGVMLPYVEDEDQKKHEDSSVHLGDAHCSGALCMQYPTKPVHDAEDGSYAIWEQLFLSHFESALETFAASLLRPKLEGEDVSKRPDTECHSIAQNTTPSCPRSFEEERLNTPTDAWRAPSKCILIDSKQTPRPEPDRDTHPLLHPASERPKAGCSPPTPSRHSPPTNPVHVPSHCDASSRTRLARIPSPSPPWFRGARGENRPARLGPKRSGRRHGRWASCGHGAAAGASAGGVR